METQTTFVRTNGAVELHAIAQVDLYLALVVDPRYAEGDDTFGLYDAFHNLCFFKLRMLVVHVLDGIKHFPYSLQEFYFAWMFLLQALHDFLYVHSIVIYSYRSMLFCHFVSLTMQK